MNADATTKAKPPATAPTVAPIITAFFEDFCDGAGFVEVPGKFVIGFDGAAVGGADGGFVGVFEFGGGFGSGGVVRLFKYNSTNTIVGFSRLNKYILSDGIPYGSSSVKLPKIKINIYIVR